MIQCWEPPLVGMKTAILLALVAGAFIIHVTDARPGRTKRNVIELAEVISCETKYTPFEVYLEINGYGCYCGFGGKGTPLDDVDRCCQQHDYCYDQAQKNGSCPGQLVYTTTYNYKKNYCKSPNSSITCDPASSYDRAETGECAQELCECDTALGKCLVGKDINQKYRKYNKDSC